MALLGILVIPLLEMLGRGFGHEFPGAAGYTQHLTLWLALLGGILAARYDRHLALSTAQFFTGSQPATR